jgi:hypothetical protein
MNHLVAVAASVVLCSACGHMGATPRPLYDGPTRTAQEVAVLSGPVAKVDGVDVSEQGAVFTLLPGCHVVTLQSRIGEGGVSGAWSADVRKQVYAFRMKAGNSYVIEVRLLPGNHSVGTANVGSVKILAIEQDSGGKKLASLAPARGRADVEACQAWAAATYGQPEPGSETDEPERAPQQAGEEPAAATGATRAGTAGPAGDGPSDELQGP